VTSKVAPHLIRLDLHGVQYVHGQVATFGQYAAEQVLGTDAQRTVSSRREPYSQALVAGLEKTRASAHRLELPDGFKPLGT
jgi:hypothetical protein